MAQDYAVGNINAGVNQLANGGRLTLTTGLPVTISDVTAATSVYFTPYLSGYISLWNGTTSVWITLPFNEITIPVPATTNTMYDVFAYNNAGAVACEVVAWTNDTTRATALTLQNGIYVKSGDATRRYIGSFRTTGVSGQTEDSYAKRYLWNYNNRVNRPMFVIDTTDSWNYTLAAFRQANANAANQLDCIVGVSEDAIEIVSSGAASNASAGINISNGVGVNSTTVNSAQIRIASGVVSGGNVYHGTGTYIAIPAVGRSFYAWLEYSTASGTTTWRGDGGGAFYQTGIKGYLMG